MKYLKVKNWEEYQHYKDRNPPWIKLHVRILKDRQFISLSRASRGLLMQLWILASEDEGRVPYDLDEIQFQLRDDTIKLNDLNVLIDKGFLKNCKQPLADASEGYSETETETETETEEEKEPQPPAGPFFTDKQVEEVDKLCKTLKAHFKKDLWWWINKCKKSGCRAEHIVYCLEQLWKYKNNASDPIGYLNNIMAKTHQNQNEQEAFADHEQRKKEELDFVGLVENAKRSHNA